jgi:hypothetical protein
MNISFVGSKLLYKTIEIDTNIPLIELAQLWNLAPWNASTIQNGVLFPFAALPTKILPTSLVQTLGCSLDRTLLDSTLES